MRCRVAPVLELALTLTLAFTAGLLRGDELRNPPEVRSKQGHLEVVLKAAVRTHAFPAAQDQNNTIYQLQSPVYILEHPGGGNKNGELVGPTIRIKRGDHLKIKLLNRLDPAKLPTDIANPSDNYPQGFATTNLHTHGLHVSPRGLADNIYVEIKPGEDHQYEYDVPRNHVPGTFWYHPHKHGSVALQTASGMAGALIVEDEKDCPYGPDKYEQKIMVLQQLHGTATCGNPLMSPQADDIYDKVKDAEAAAAPPGSSASPQGTLRFMKAIRIQKALLKGRAEKSKTATTKPKVHDAKGKMPDRFEPLCCDKAPIDPFVGHCPPQSTDPPGPPQQTVSEWLLVNGQAAPTITICEGEIQRWRFIHAGIDEVINLTLVKTTKTKDSCKHERVCMTEIAVDGIPREKMTPREHRYLYPAYRWDVLVQIPKIEDGVSYALYSDCSPAPVALNNVDTPYAKIADINLVKAKPGKCTKFPTAEAIRRYVPVEFRGGISDTEVGNRRWTLKFDFPSTKPSRFLINGHEYSEDIDRFVRLNTAEEWRIESGPGIKNAAGHPFHVHVNPFLHYVQATILSLSVAPTDPTVVVNQTTTLNQIGIAGSQVQFRVRLRAHGSAAEPQPFVSTTPVTPTTTLADFKKTLETDMTTNLPRLFTLHLDEADADGTTRPLSILSDQGNIDELSIDFVADPNATGDVGVLSFTRDRKVVDRVWRDTLLAPNSGTEVVRTRFRDWTGDTVLHCHIVDHEDQGMMKNIRILGPEEPIPPRGTKVAAHGAGRAARTPSVAPQFALPDTTGRIHSLRELSGRRAILVFFRGSGCLACAEQLHAFRKIYGQLVAAGVPLVAVSSTSIADLRRAEAALPAQNKLPFLLLADPELAAFKEYGCLGEDDRQPLHGTFVIDAKGRVEWRDVGGEPYLNVKRVFEEATRSASLVGRAQAAR
jgi:FtsP/CotA-like multicopper oxidase with cupredoxin domain/peroxiredoxin